MYISEYKVVLHSTRTEDGKQSVILMAVSFSLEILQELYGRRSVIAMATQDTCKRRDYYEKRLVVTHLAVNYVNSLLFTFNSSAH